MSTNYFRPSFYLLQSEGYLLRASLASGLTDLRNADYAENRGRYLSGFFQLSIGFERLMKVTLIIDRMARADLLPPTFRELKAHGHDLDALFEAVAGCASADVRLLFEGIGPNSIEREILGLLSRFAKAARYHNLDLLLAGRSAGDPLAEWKGILDRILRSDVRVASIRRVERKALEMEILFGDWTWFMQNDLAGQPLSLRSGSELTGLLSLAAPRAVLRVFRLLAPLVEALSEAVDRAHVTNRRIDPAHLAVPAMREFVEFLGMQERQVLSRKRWP